MQRIAAENEARRKAEMQRIAAENEAKRKAEIQRMAAEREAMMKAEVERVAAERARFKVEAEAKDPRITTESFEKIKMRIISAFDFMVLKKDHSNISQDNQVPKFFYHPTFNPYSPDFRMNLDSRLAEFCPCVGYEIVDINEKYVVCILKKRASSGAISIYQLSIEHKGGLLNITSFDITHAKQIQ
jgi:hypothetical protein